MAERYLASQPWAAKAKYILRTDEAFIYFEDWDPLEDDEAARCTPFAMIYTTKGRNPDEKPITIISDSAYVRFARKFSFTSPDPGRVIGGALEGNVQIRGDNNLQIMGRNFVFNEEAMRSLVRQSRRFCLRPAHRQRAWPANRTHSRSRGPRSRKTRRQRF